jgi:hypothetical protein
MLLLVLMFGRILAQVREISNLHLKLLMYIFLFKLVVGHLVMLVLNPAVVRVG